MEVKRLTRDEEHAGSEISDSIEAIFEKITKHVHASKDKNYTTTNLQIFSNWYALADVHSSLHSM